jgi:hypothetical protein
MGKREPAERSIDFALRYGLELIHYRQFNPIDVYMELAFEMLHKGQGQFIEAATKKTNSQSISLTERDLSAIVQRRAKYQRRRLNAKSQLFAKGRQLDAPARSYEELAAHLLLQGAYRFGDRGLRERKPLRRLSEMQVRCDRKEAIDLPQVHAALRQPIYRPRRLNATLDGKWVIGRAATTLLGADVTLGSENPSRRRQKSRTCSSVSLAARPD